MKSEFEKAFPVPAHWIEFDGKSNKYYCPFVADATASEYQSKWVVWQHQQAKVDELQKRLDAAIYLLPSIKAENDLWGCDQVEHQIELLEQALKGENK
ncbi:MAG: hypothetical protein RSC68_23525 [Acinetobacter sp.]